MSRLHANQPRARRAAPVPPAQSWLRLLLIAIAVLVVASSCADDTENRQFATDPKTPRPTPTSQPAESLPATPPGRAMPVASPEVLVDRRGSPATVYVEVGGLLRAVTQDSVTTVIGEPVLAFAASPNGEQVAALVPSEVADGVGLVVHAADGEREQRIEVVLPGGAAATPVPASATDTGLTLSWAPQGGRLLLGTTAGDLVDIHLDGSVQFIETRVPLTGLTQARWSPRGDQIGAVYKGEDGNGRLALIDPAAEPARVNVIAPVGRVAGEAASVESFAWKPYGDGVLFLQGTLADDGISHGQLVSWDQASNTTQVMATGGQVGPTGTIRSFSIAPDGKAVAYAVDIRTSGGREFGGLYVRSLTQAQIYRVPVGPDAAVAAFWWLGNGLAWAGIDRGEDGVETVMLRWIDGSGRQQAIQDIRLAPAATPMASPVPAGTPAASPVASPVATPVAMATPPG